MIVMLHDGNIRPASAWGWLIAEVVEFPLRNWLLRSVATDG